MIFHENRLFADDSHDISNLVFFPKSGKMLQNLASAAVVICPLRIKIYHSGYSGFKHSLRKLFEHKATSMDLVSRSTDKVRLVPVSSVNFVVVKLIITLR